MDTAMPLQLLQPLDGANPASTPVRLSGPEQRLTVTPDPGVGDESLLPPSQLLIGKDGESRSIWPVHVAGWQALGWQLNAASWEVSSAQRSVPQGCSSQRHHCFSVTTTVVVGATPTASLAAQIN
jgi:hypothetical protein